MLRWESQNRIRPILIAGLASLSLFLGGVGEELLSHEASAAKPVTQALGASALAASPHASINHNLPIITDSVGPPVSGEPNLAGRARAEVTPEEFAQWSKVAVCEEGGDWHVYGPRFSGGLGITNHNWKHYGGRLFAPNAARATPDEQIVIAEKIQPDPPDQDGCDGSW